MAFLKDLLVTGAARFLNGIYGDLNGNVLNYGVCDTQAGTQAKEVELNGTFELKEGSEVAVKFINGNTTSNPTLNVNSTGAKNILMGGANAPSSAILANYTYLLRYNGSAWDLIGSTIAERIGTSSVGSATHPIYLNDGVPSTTTYSLSATVNGGTANRIAYYSGNNAISSGSITTDGGYLGNVSRLSINTAHQNDYQAYINGTTFLNNDVTIGSSATRAIKHKGTKATYSMIRFLDNTANGNGNGLSIGGGGVVIVGSGESASNFQSLIASDTEQTYLLSDGGVFIEANGQTIANRLGFLVTTAGHLTPVKAEANNSNAQSLGISGNRWKAAFLGSADTYGSTAKGIYWNSGVPTEMAYSVNANVQAGTAEKRIAWYSSTNTISSGTIATDGAYLSNVSYLTVNEAHQTSYRFKVNGTSYFKGNITHEGHILPSADSTYTIGSTTMHLSSGYFDNFYVSTDTAFTGAGSGKTGVSISGAGGAIELVGATPFIDFHHNNSTTDYTSRIISDAASRIRVMSSGTVADLSYNGRTIKPILYNSGVFYASGNIESNSSFIVNRNSATGGYYLCGNDKQYGCFSINAIGTANSGTNNETQGTLGQTKLHIGNSIARPSAGTAGGANNAKGYLYIYGAGTGAGELTYNDSMFQSDKSLYFSHSSTSGICNEVRGLMATNDYWRVAGGATAANSGYMEIATADDANEPIYVRQYTGAFTTLARTLTLMDSSGNTVLATDNALLRAGKGVSWNQSSQSAMLRMTTQAGWSPMLALKANTGWWTMGHYNSSGFNDHLLFGFLADVDVSGVTNAKNHLDYKVRLLPTVYATNTATETDRAFVTSPYASSSAAVGSTTQPVYVDANGVVSTTTYSLSATINSGTANRMAYYSGNNTISSGSITTDGGYLGNVSHLSINTAHQTGYSLYVNGASYLTGNLTIQRSDAEADIFVSYTGTNTHKIKMCAATSGNAGIYDETYGKYLVYSDNSGNVILPGNANTATKFATARKIDGIPFDGSADIVHYGTCTTAAATKAKVVTCAGFSLVTGARVYVKFSNAQTYNGQVTLNVNSTGAKNVCQRGTTASVRYQWNAGEVLGFVYDGTNWIIEAGGVASTTYYGNTKLSASLSSTSTSLAATPSTVNALRSMLNDLPDYSSSATYDVGDRVYHETDAYECNTAITTAEAWTAAHWTKLDSVQTQIDKMSAGVTSGTYSGLFNGQIYTTNEGSQSAISGPIPAFLNSTAGDGYKAVYHNGSFMYHYRNGKDSSTKGYAILQLGNAASASVAGGTQGYLRMYGSETTFAQLQLVNSPSENITVSVPAIAGELMSCQGAQTITGVKTFSGNNTFSGENTFTGSNLIKNTNWIIEGSVTKGTNPGGTCYKQLVVLDKSADKTWNATTHKRLQMLSFETYTNGNTVASLTAYKNSATEGNSAVLAAIYDKANNVAYATAPTYTGLTDNSTKIVTTAYLRSIFRTGTAAATTSNCPNGCFYFQYV